MPIARRSAGLPNRSLIGRVTATQPADNLPLIHVTWTGFAREIVLAGQLETRLCPALNRDLLYFFALRPAYGKTTDDVKSDQVGLFPSIFILDPSRMGPPHHVYPFDTGGALAGVFGDTPNPTVFLEDYELAPSLDAAASHIAWAFGERRGYFRGDLLDRFPDELPQFDEVARSFVSVARLASSTHNAPDRRASSVELAYSNHVSLLHHCHLIVLPKQYLEDGLHRNDQMLEALSSLNVDVRTYDWQPNFRPADYREILADIVEQYLSETGALDD